jgi:sugar O-acyltransferase (sialic acid O-acetyltransferase NeuD family)
VLRALLLGTDLKKANILVTQMIKGISIIGAGGFGREVKQLIDEINLHHEVWEIFGFYDSFQKQGTSINDVPVLGGMEAALKSECENFVLAIGNPAALRDLSSEFIEHGKTFPNIVHPLSSMGCQKTNQIGVGNIFTYGFHMTTNIEIGSFNIFNTRVTLGHDVRIGSFNVFLPNAQVSGNVSVGDENLFGMNSSILQKKSIGSRNKIGAHSFVATNLGSDSSVFGTPAVQI